MLRKRVQEALGRLGGAAKEGLLALSVAVGLGVLTEMLEEEVDEVVAPNGEWNRGLTAVRHGDDGGEVTLGGHRVEVRRPRVRTADGEYEVPLATYEQFADRDPMPRVALVRVLAASRLAGAGDSGGYSAVRTRVAACRSCGAGRDSR